MSFSSIFIANRGEIAIRIARAVNEAGARAVMAYSADDADSLHVLAGDEAILLPAKGAAAYLDIAAVVEAARQAGCQAVHPGYGFLSENAQFARACATAGLVFVGPSPDTLEALGDKVRARRLAEDCGVPILEGIDRAVSLAEAGAFFAALPHGEAMMIKARAGGGGRGMRVVRDATALEEAFARCVSEALAGFGDGDVFVERYLARARHVEVQILGDGRCVSHLWERECSLQRRHQKVMEVAPSPSLTTELREAIIAAAVRLAEEVGYHGAGTFEFLTDESSPGRFAFLEANPRIQVEHTVTEAIAGVDIVRAQIDLASGRTLKELGLDQPGRGPPRGYAIQLRVNAERLTATGEALPSGGVIGAFQLPTGPGIRVDTHGYAGYRTNPAFDSLLAKVIVHAPGDDYGVAVRRARRALAEFHIGGVHTNVDFLTALLARREVEENAVHTSFITEHAAELLSTGNERAARYFEGGPDRAEALAFAPGPAGTEPIPSPLHGKVVSLDCRDGEVIAAGSVVAVLEAMKMEHVVRAAHGGLVRLLAVDVGDIVSEGQPLAYVEPDDRAAATVVVEAEPPPDEIRPDLARVLARWNTLRDESRPEAVARRRSRGQRTARENLEDLCDPGTFIEYGAFALAGQRRRRSEEELLKLSPADGLVTGIGEVNGKHFPPERARAAVMAYDATVFAGTQGNNNHQKTDRLIHLADQWSIPFVMFAEGGGGRPGETDRPKVASLDTATFRDFAGLSGKVPLVGIVSGRCFAGNAALLGCCDVIIGTQNANIGMSGPAMIEGGGLGVFRPEDIGPIDVQTRNGVVDVAVADEVEAVAVAKTYLSYFQGSTAEWSAADQRRLRHVVPENRLRAYDVRQAISLLADSGSVLELRSGFGIGIVTALARLEGRPVAVVANNPTHLGGAIDPDAADKLARFMQLCDAHALPMVSLCDTPGFMVGPEVERRAQVRHVSRLFLNAAALRVPYFTVVLRKGYGLGAQSVMGGHSLASGFCVSWPTGEFGAMGIEGAVRLGYKRELEAIADPAERQQAFDDMVARAYANGRAINMATALEIDAVIDPADTRAWLIRGIKSMPGVRGEPRRFVDAW